MSGTMPAQEPASPCISVCALDERDICIGCYRSATEITDWLMASTKEKRAIIARAAERRDNERHEMALAGIRTIPTASLNFR